nr:HigA family addiction module antitoxin [Stanieria cyanosphaera]
MKLIKYDDIFCLIVHGKQRITADTALRLARYFNMSPRFWLGLQMDYDLDVVEDEIGERLNKEVAVLTSKQEYN